MIDGNALASAMRKAYSAGGYEVAGLEMRRLPYLWLRQFGRWEIVMPQKLAPRKVLGLLAEHLGELPENTAWSISKVRDAQTMLPSEAAEAATALVRREVKGAAIGTKLRWCDGQIWQSYHGSVQLIEDRLVQIADAEVEPQFTEDGILWNDGNVVLILYQSGMKLPPHVRKALECIDIAGGKEE